MNTDPAESERYMIFEGVIQWTQAVALQSDRVAAAQTAQFRPGDRPGAHRLPGMNFRAECDYFSVAVDMLFQFKRRATDLGSSPRLTSRRSTSSLGGTAWTCGTSACTSQTT